MINSTRAKVWHRSMPKAELALSELVVISVLVAAPVDVKIGVLPLLFALLLPSLDVHGQLLRLLHDAVLVALRVLCAQAHGGLSLQVLASREDVSAEGDDRAQRVDVLELEGPPREAPAVRRARADARGAAVQQAVDRVVVAVLRRLPQRAQQRRVLELDVVVRARGAEAERQQQPEPQPARHGSGRSA
eukprot:CAMPEP_0168441864 /NCGR_PEP_ID=MMETSP0228-20121227/43712_1 /TAXON_ID=133427 /ORGANISM="Protoceratium reticulatum, Strain CCCM 535 (=CCMP 1889)" /LENGTH=188 /DNA_ID=CAMNT_0008456207 /DNA_START=12 /DNA_END=576 /DNA_ORIENTATION=-